MTPRMRPLPAGLSGQTRRAPGEESWIHQEYQVSLAHVLDKRDGHYYYESTL